MSEFKRWLIERFKIERKRFDRTGVYAYTQRAMAYNSNKIEGSTLTPEQTASLFDNGTLPVNDDYYRAKDVEEMNGHFLMFNHMLDTLEEELTENLIKRMHYELKSGVFEDRANGYAIGDYKKRPNMIGMYKTALPKDVEAEMRQLLDWYHKQEKTMKTLAEFHARYESIHPFQDGNGRTGRMILFRESLKYDELKPFIILDDDRSKYLEGLKEYREHHKVDQLLELMQKEAETYYLATVEGDQPRVRPFGTAHIFEGKLYIQTGKKKDVSKQLHANPKAELCAFKGGEWIRVAGELVEDDRVEARQSMLDAYPSLKKMYAVDDGNTEVFYFKNSVATISSFTHEPKVIKF